MTKEEAIDILRVISPPRESKRIFDEFVQAIDMAIEALEEPSTDIDNALALLDAIRSSGRMDYYSDYCALHDAISSISAEPESKKGKWIKVHGFCTPGGDPVWACSECGKGVHIYGIEHGTYGADVSDGQWKACPNCGCIMEGEKHD